MFHCLHVEEYGDNRSQAMRNFFVPFFHRHLHDQHAMREHQHHNHTEHICALMHQAVVYGVVGEFADCARDYTQDDLPYILHCEDRLVAVLDVFGHMRVPVGEFFRGILRHGAASCLCLCMALVSVFFQKDSRHYYRCCDLRPYTLGVHAPSYEALRWPRSLFRGPTLSCYYPKAYTWEPRHYVVDKLLCIYSRPARE